MSSVINPVGPEEPKVYWLRRILVIAAILAVIALLWMLLGRSGGSGSASASTSPSATPVPSGSASVSPSASPSGSESPSGSASPSDSAAAAPCADSDIGIEVSSEKNSVAVGAGDTFIMKITNTSSAPCSRDVGAKVNSFVISSGGYRVWSSDDCNPGGAEDVKVLPPGEPYAVQATWPGTVTTPACEKNAPTAQPGAYDVVGNNGAAASPPFQFAVTAG